MLLNYCVDGIQGKAASVDNVIALRNSLLQSTNLRSMDNLELQLQQQAKLTHDASRSLVMLLQVAATPACATLAGAMLGTMPSMHLQHLLLTNIIKPGACVC